MPTDTPTPKVLAVGTLDGVGRGHRIDLTDDTFAVIDLETSGLSPSRDRIVEVAVSRVHASGEVLSRWVTLLNPRGGVGPTDIHRITPAMVARAPFFDEVAGALLDELRDAVVVAHNASFESGFLTAEFARAGLAVPAMPALCTLRVARAAELGTDNHRLGTCCARFGIELRDAHAAMGDVDATASLLIALLVHHHARHGTPPTLTVAAAPAPLPQIASTAEVYTREAHRAGANPRPPRLVVPDGHAGLVRLPSELRPAPSPTAAPDVPEVHGGRAPQPPPTPPRSGGLTARRRPGPARGDTVVELRTPGSFGHRHPRVWATTYTPLGGSHHDGWPDHVEGRAASALSHAAVATWGTDGTATEQVRWWAAACERLLQRGHLPPVPRSAATAAALTSAEHQAPTVLAQLPAVTALDPHIELHPRFEAPFWGELCRRHPNLARWCVPQASIDALVDGDADRFADFVIATPWAAPLIVELDGAQHAAASGPDAARDAALTAAGCVVHRCAGADALDPSSALWARIATLAATAPAGTVTATDVRDLCGPAQLHRFTYATVTAAVRGWLTPGGHWDLEVRDDLNIISEASGAPLFDVLAAVSDLWDLGVAPKSFSFGADRWVRTPSGYRCTGDTRPHTPTVALHLEARTPAHAPQPTPGTLPAVCIRPSIPAGHHPWRAHRRPRRALHQDRGVVDASLHTISEALFAHRLRGPQLAATARALAGGDLVVLLPTGAGKSVVYQLAGLLAPGATIAVDPINALIDDQVRRLVEAGIDRVVGVSSSRQRDPAARAAVADDVATGDALFTFCSPERLGIAEFRDRIGDVAAGVGVGLLVVDEAHCVSEWGHDFRSSYLRIGALLRRYATDPDTNTAPPLVALTGTASPAVLRDVLRELGIDDDPDAVLRPAGFDRPNLRYGIDRRRGDRTDRLRRLLTEAIPADLELGATELFDGSGTHTGIVFVPHVNGPHGVDAVRAEVLSALGDAGFAARVGTYSGGRPRGVRAADWDCRRAETATAFAAGELDVLVATKSFGMGVDLDTVRWTVHVGFPSSIEAYAQEAGRAGRDAARPASCQMLVSDPEPAPGVPPGEDLDRQLFFHRRSFPGAAVEKHAALALWDELRSAADRSGGSAPVKVPFGDGDEQLRHRALHRLLTIGVVADYTVGYGSRELTVRLRHPDADTLDMAFLDWANRVEPGRSNARRAALGRAPVDVVARTRHHIAAAVDVVYSVIEPARRHALREMRNLATTASGDDEIRERIGAYLADGPLAATLRSIVERDDVDITAAVRSLEVVAAAGAAEWLGAVTRQLEGSATHPVLHAGRALAEALTEAGDRATFDRHVATMFTELVRYGVDASAAAVLVEWLAVQLRNRDDGRRWSWASSLWALWPLTGWPAAALERHARRVLAEAARGNADPVEALAVLASRLDAALELVDNWTRNPDGGAHVA